MSYDPNRDAKRRVDLRAQILAGAHAPQQMTPDRVPSARETAFAMWTARRGRWFRAPWALVVSLFNIAAAALSILVGAVVVLVWFVIKDAPGGLLAAFRRVFGNWPGKQLPRSLRVAWAFATRPALQTPRKET